MDTETKKNARRKLIALLPILLPILLALVALVSLAGTSRAADSDSRLLNREKMQISAGTAFVRTASFTYTSWQSLIVIAPDSANCLDTVRVVIDLDHASNGFVAGYTSQTIQFSVARKVDGTNWRTCNNLATTALAASSAGSQSIELAIGNIGPTEQLEVTVKLSSTTGQPDIALPYVIYYQAGVRAAITPQS